MNNKLFKFCVYFQVGSGLVVGLSSLLLIAVSWDYAKKLSTSFAKDAGSINKQLDITVKTLNGVKDILVDFEEAGNIYSKTIQETQETSKQFSEIISIWSKNTKDFQIVTKNISKTLHEVQENLPVKIPNELVYDSGKFNIRIPEIKIEYETTRIIGERIRFPKEAIVDYKKNSEFSYPVNFRVKYIELLTKEKQEFKNASKTLSDSSDTLEKTSKTLDSLSQRLGVSGDIYESLGKAQSQSIKFIQLSKDLSETQITAFVRELENEKKTVQNLQNNLSKFSYFLIILGIFGLLISFSMISSGIGMFLISKNKVSA